VFRRYSGAYLFQSEWIWRHLPVFLQRCSVGRGYGRHLHALVRRQAERGQYFATYFLRNRPELELMRRLLDQKPRGSRVDVSVLACSKGAEVYSVMWTIRSARPDLAVTIHAVDISEEIVRFAEGGVYSCKNSSVSQAPDHDANSGRGDLDWNTRRDQQSSIFERLTAEEVEAIFEIEGGQARVRSWLREGIIWMSGDASDAALVSRLGPQDMVMANRFLCHMEPPSAEKCLRNIARLVKPGGHLFVSGIDLDVRTRVAKGLGWKPVTELMREIHEGDPSLEQGWPLEYWGLEPFCDDDSDWTTRYASVFQIGESQ
jgi:chemotaxis protein methyltransferase CheR